MMGFGGRQIWGGFGQGSCEMGLGYQMLYNIRYKLPWVFVNMLFECSRLLAA